MASLLGIDYGDSKIGLAIGYTGSIAAPLKIINNNDALWETLSAILLDNGIDEVVVGWPTSLRGHANERTEATEKFIKAFKKRFDIPVRVMDERLTSAVAKKKNISGRLDAVAATEIVQSYIDSHA